MLTIISFAFCINNKIFVKYITNEFKIWFLLPGFWDKIMDMKSWIGLESLLCL
jgi:hypothetical protein